MALLTATMSSAAYAQDISADKVPSSVTSAFKARFPNASNASWEMEKEGGYEAVFKMNGNKASASFDNAGKWMETESEIKVSALPASVQSAISKDFAGFKVKEASKIESMTNGNSFEAEIEKSGETFDAIFAPDGKLLSKAKAEEKDDKGDKEDKD